MSKQKVLITGANGFVGSNLTRLLSRDPLLEVYAMVRPDGPVNFLYDFQKDSRTGENLFELIEADLWNEDSIVNAALNMDIIIHLAGLVSDWGKWSAFYELNVEGTNRILRGAAKADVSRIIYLSSLTVHAMSGHTYSDENTLRDMKNFPYGETKKIGEDLVDEWVKSASSGSPRDAAIVRPGFVIYGPYDKNTFVNVIDGVESGKFGFIDEGKHLISYVYVENLCHGISKLIYASKVEGAYNILDGNMTWKEWIRIWSDAIGVKSPRLTVPYWLMVPITAFLEFLYKLLGSKKPPILTLYRIRIMHKDLAFVSKRIKSEADYSPVVSLEDGVEATLNFYRKVKKR